MHYVVLLLLIAFSPMQANDELIKKTTLAAKSTLPILSGVGGDFNAVGDDGEAFQLSRYKDKVVLLFFGYTNCADVCPFTLGYLKQVYEKLTPAEQEQVQIIFVTIDPEYDTPEHLQTFVHFFNKDFVGVTGSREKIDEIVDIFQATYNLISGGEKVNTDNIRRTNQKVVEKPEEDKGYLYGHTVNIYLMDGKGRTRSLDFTGTDTKVMAGKIRQLIAENNKGKVTSTDGGTTDLIQAGIVKSAKASQLRTSKLPVLLNYWVHLGPPNTRVMAGYGEFVNTSDRDIVLTGMSDEDFDHVDMHDTVIKNGVGNMVKQNKLLIKAGESLIFEPGKRHIMLNTPLKAFKHGGATEIKLNYYFPDNGEVAQTVVSFPVTLSGAGCAAMSPPL